MSVNRNAHTHSRQSQFDSHFFAEAHMLLTTNRTLNIFFYSVTNETLIVLVHVWAFILFRMALMNRVFPFFSWSNENQLMELIFPVVISPFFVLGSFFFHTNLNELGISAHPIINRRLFFCMNIFFVVVQIHSRIFIRTVRILCIWHAWVWVTGASPYKYKQ